MPWNASVDFSFGGGMVGGLCGYALNRKKVDSSAVL